MRNPDLIILCGVWLVLILNVVSFSYYLNNHEYDTILFDGIGVLFWAWLAEFVSVRYYRKRKSK